MLLSFAARFDAAKALVAVGSGASSPPMSPDGRDFSASSSCCWGLIRWNNGQNESGASRRPSQGTYFFPLVVSYAIGLFMANTAVYLMNMGQPALLYVVPATLGTLAYLGWKRHELQDLWVGPKIFVQAEDIAYGHRPERSQDNKTVVELPRGSSGLSNSGDEELDTFVDDEVGDLPLLDSSTPTQSA